VLIWAETLFTMTYDSPADKQLIAWLNDAYSMERSLAKVLENHAEDARGLPDVREKDMQHLYETRRHAEKVERCLGFLGQKPSTVKSVMGTVMGKAQSVASGMFGDEIIKNFISDYAMEHFEIACYRALIAAADEAGRPEIVQICEEILREEQAMARWLEQRIPDIAKMTVLQAPAAR
jgi:ferritin-like metal-binding protein YciE